MSTLMRLASNAFGVEEKVLIYGCTKTQLMYMIEAPIDDYIINLLVCQSETPCMPRIISVSKHFSTKEEIRFLTDYNNFIRFGPNPKTPRKREPYACILAQLWLVPLPPRCYTTILVKLDPIVL